MVINKENIDSINPSSDKKIRWISFQSLCGGMTLGAEAAFGCPPLCTIDFDGIDHSLGEIFFTKEKAEKALAEKEKQNEQCI